MSQRRSAAHDDRIPHSFSPPATWAAWATSRLLALLVLANGREAGAITDLRIYHGWALDAWDRGLLPGRDYSWEYPVGALPFIALPVSDLVTYAVAFVSVALLVDGVVVAMLLRQTTESGRAAGLNVWLLAPALLGSISFLRLDIVPTALCLAALVALTRPRLAGALLALGALVKIWPLALAPFLLSHSVRRRKFLFGFLAVCAVGSALALAMGLGAAIASPLTNQVRRGVQVESIAALPWMWKQAFGGSVTIVRLESFEVHEPGIQLAAWVVYLAGAIALLLLLRLSFSKQVDVVPLCAAAVIVLVLSNKVFSPQYLIWILGTTCLALTRPGSFSWPLSTVACVVALLTHLVFPLGYSSFLDGSVVQLTLLTTRDLLLMCMAGLLVARARIEPSSEPA